jgi:DHA2 family multidrug resistance protein
LVDLRIFADRNFSVGCLLSFVLGAGLFGSVYLMPVFLGYVSGHNAFEVGKIILVTGVTQLLIAPVAVFLEQRYDERILSATGFLLFGFGLMLSCDQTPFTDYDEMFWPQVVRGMALMFCILPPTRLALEQFEKVGIPNASGLQAGENSLVQDGVAGQYSPLLNMGYRHGLSLRDPRRLPERGAQARRLVEAEGR